MKINACYVYPVKGLTAQPAETLQVLTAAVQGVWWRPQAEPLADYAARFFQEVRSVSDKRDKEYASRILGAMYPRQLKPSNELIDRSEELMEELGDELVVLSRPPRETLGEAPRSRACREFAVAQESS